jgi:hypothetical protein
MLDRVRAIVERWREAGGERGRDHSAFTVLVGGGPIEWDGWAPDADSR